MSSYDLVADIGGTNTRVALSRDGTLLPDSVKRYRNSDYPGLEPVLKTFLEAHTNVTCHGACVAIAGPIAQGRGSLTNLDWDIDVARIGAATGAKNCALINDLQAQGHALGHLAEHAVTTLLSAPEPAADATKLVIGVGTGFNVACVFETPWGRFVPPAEAGHTTLPVRSGPELEWAQQFETTHGFCAVEDMLSGRGLERLYRWVAGTSALDAGEIVAAISSAADIHAQKTAEIFARMLGAVTGDLCLIHLPKGGVFFAGGVARALEPHLLDMGFKAGMHGKGRFAEFMTKFPVHVIEDDYAALTGCARVLHAKAVQTP